MKLNKFILNNSKVIRNILFKKHYIELLTLLIILFLPLVSASFAYNNVDKINNPINPTKNNL